MNVTRFFAVAVLTAALAGGAGTAYAGHVCDGEACEVNPTCDRPECVDEDRAWASDVYGYVAFAVCHTTLSDVDCRGPVEDAVWDVHDVIRGG